MQRKEGQLKVIPRKKKNEIAENAIRLLNRNLNEDMLLTLWCRILSIYEEEISKVPILTAQPLNPEKILMVRDEAEERKQFSLNIIRKVQERGKLEYINHLEGFLRKFIQEYYWQNQPSAKDKNYRGRLLNKGLTFHLLFEDIIMSEIQYQRGFCSAPQEMS